MLQAAALHIGQALAANGVVHHPYIGIPDANHLAMALLFMALWPTSLYQQSLMCSSIPLPARPRPQHSNNCRESQLSQEHPRSFIPTLQQECNTEYDNDWLVSVGKRSTDDGAALLARLVVTNSQRESQ
jgi:hypothetical protein